MIVLGDNVDVECRTDSVVVAAADRAGPVDNRHRLGRRDGNTFIKSGRRETGRADQSIDGSSAVDICVRCLIDHVDAERSGDSGAAGRGADARGEVRRVERTKSLHQGRHRGRREDDGTACGCVLRKLECSRGKGVGTAGKYGCRNRDLGAFVQSVFNFEDRGTGDDARAAHRVSDGWSFVR